MRRMLLTLQHAVAAPTRNPRLAVVIGRLLGSAFLLCFATGLYSHFLQEPLPWMHFPTQPAQLYQVSQGIHITAGIACFPLILAKLYTVFPNLFETPPITGVGNLLARASIAVFVGASLVEITIGLLNTYQFYPWPFGFREVHFALSFVIVGSLAIHIAVKLPIIARYWRKRDGYAPPIAFDAAERAEIDAPLVDALPAVLQRAPGAQAVSGLTGRLFRWIDGAPHPVDAEDAGSGHGQAGGADDGDARALASGREPVVATHSSTRRAFLLTVGAGVTAVVVLTAGQSFAWLGPFNLFAPRAKGIGPQSVPVNRTAAAAQVLDTAMAPDWSLTVTGMSEAGPVTSSFTRSDLMALPQTTVDLPISCVEGWSQQATWTGVRLGDLISQVTGSSDAALRITSLEKQGGYRVTQMGSEYVADPATLVALMVNGETLGIDHGYPARIIAPGRPGVLQTKWLSALEVL